VYTLEPYLISIGEGGPIRMILNLGCALSVSEWQAGTPNDATGLPTTTKQESRFHAAFYWSDAEGNEVEEKAASHLAVILRSPSASGEDCLREQQILADAITAARDGSFEDLAMFNH
jgi:hypothetical protein